MDQHINVNNYFEIIYSKGLFADIETNDKEFILNTIEEVYNFIDEVINNIIPPKIYF